MLLFVLLFYGPGDGTAVTITTKASFFKDCLLISIRRKGSNLQFLKTILRISSRGGGGRPSVCENWEALVIYNEPDGCRILTRSHNCGQ